MAALKTISRSAVASFSPTHNYIAAGTVSGSLDSSFSSSTFLEVYKLDFSTNSPDLPLIASCTTSESVCRVSWSAATDQYQSGLLAGSLTDGSINIWDPTLLISDRENGVQSVPLANLEKHQQKVQGLDFNPLQPNFLASGSENGTVYIWDLSDAGNPKHFPPLQNKDAVGLISYLSWNRKVQNILATTSTAGTCVVWDLKKQKHILSFSDPSGSKRYSALQWNPELATKLVVAVEDDNAPYLQVWDLRNASQPAQQLSGHTKGILSVAWCPCDSSILVSCGKDNRTLCWDVSTGQVVGELPNNNSWNFDVQWSPRIPGVLSTSSYDGRIGLYNVESCYHGSSPTVMLKAPRWLKTPVGASFGFGGKLATFAAKPVPGRDSVLTSEVQIHSLAMEEDVAKCSDEFEAAASGDAKSHMKSFCERKASEAKFEQDREVWEFLKIMFQEDGGRKALLNQLGFQLAEKEASVPDDISDTAADASVSQHTDESAFQVIDDGEDFFEHLEEPKPAATAMNGKHEEEPVVEEEAVVEQQVIDHTDDTIEQALVVGNFKGAVEHCLAVNRLADALVIAFAGSPELWEKTRNQFLKSNSRSYLQVLSAITKHDLLGLIENRPLTAWKETLALLGTYCSGEEWSSYVNTLASKLDSAGNVQASTLCYIAAGNDEKTVELLSRSLQSEHDGKQAAGSILQDLVEKSIVLAIATDKRQASAALAAVVERYVEFLANQGLLDSATVYLSLIPGQLSDSLAVLRDRIYRSGQVAESGKASAAQASAPAAQTFSTFPELGHDRYQQPTPTPHPTPSPHQYPTPSQFPNPTPAPSQFQRPGAPSSFHPQFPAQPPAPQFTPARQMFPTTPHFTPAPAAHQLFPGVAPPAAAASQPPAPPTIAPSVIRPMNPASFPRPSPQQPMVPPPFNSGVPPAPQQPFQPAPFPAPSQPPHFSPAPVAKPLISHLTTESPPAPPAPQPTVQNVDTSNVKDDLKPVVDALRRLFTDTSDASGPGKKREVDDNSRKLGALFVKLNAGDVSPVVSGKLVQIGQSLDARNYAAAQDIINWLTGEAWDECGLWLAPLRRMVKFRQVMG